MSRPVSYTFSSESVGEGHPDKVADSISDSVLDACFAQDRFSRVACETLVKSNMVTLAGEITIPKLQDKKTGKTRPIDEVINIGKVVRDAIRDGTVHKIQARFQGPVDEFPFDQPRSKGQFHIAGQVRDPRGSAGSLLEVAWLRALAPVARAVITKSRTLPTWSPLLSNTTAPASLAR